MKNEEKLKLKCARCGKIVCEYVWEVGLKRIDNSEKPVAPAYFCLCSDCRLTWTLAMGKWLSEGKVENNNENGT